MSNPPSNGGEFLLSLLRNSQPPAPPQQPPNHSFPADPAVAAVGPTLPQLWHDPLQPQGFFTQGYFGNFGVGVLGDGGVVHQQLHEQNGVQRLMFGSIPFDGFNGLEKDRAGLNFGVAASAYRGVEGLNGLDKERMALNFGSIMPGNHGVEGFNGLNRDRLLVDRTGFNPTGYHGVVGFNGLDRDRPLADRAGLNPTGYHGVVGFNGVDRDRQFADQAGLTSGSSTSGYRVVEQERIGNMGNGWGNNQYGSLNMRMPFPGLLRNPVGVGNLGSEVMEKKSGNEGVMRMWSEDGKKVGEFGLGGQLDRPGPPAGSNLHSVLPSDVDASKKLHTGVGGDVKNDRKEDIDEDINELGEEMVDSLLLEDESESKNTKKPHQKEFRSDLRGQYMLSQRARNLKRQMRCRRDIEQLNNPFIEIYKSLIPAEEEKAKQKQLLMSLEKIILKEWPHARLYLYGSCASSFGVSKSDIDLCLAFGDMNFNKSEVLLKLAEMLETNHLQNVQPLTRARVPIVKLTDPVTGLACDICINNVLAVVNTKLLRDYAKVDVRLHQLAFIVKHWAKCRRVNETYQGTLSSYAYVLMCIHFLQQRKPAILPCLQRMETTYSVNVDDIRCAFFDQVEKLHSFGSHNTESVAQLVWGFFNYWAFCHDYSNSVISIRTGSTISKREKDWTRRVGNDRHLICIEDPFETSHDLGRVVDRRSIQVLREEFERAADIMQYDPHPFVTLFEPYVPI